METVSDLNSVESITIVTATAHALSESGINSVVHMWPQETAGHVAVNSESLAT
jgi:hypothetical protein